MAKAKRARKGTKSRKRRAAPKRNSRKLATAKRNPRKVAAKRRAKRSPRRLSAKRRVKRNPLKRGYIRTKTTQRVLKTDRHTRSQAGKLLAARKRRGKKPSRVKTGPRDYLDKETAAYVLRYGAKKAAKRRAKAKRRAAPKRAAAPRKRRVTRTARVPRARPAAAPGDITETIYTRVIGQA